MSKSKQGLYEQPTKAHLCNITSSSFLEKAECLILHKDTLIENL